MDLPGKDIALATKFADYNAAAIAADKIADDDPDWDYGVEKTPGGYVITVHDNSEDDYVFLGYL